MHMKKTVDKTFPLPCIQMNGNICLATLLYVINVCVGGDWVERGGEGG